MTQTDMRHALNILREEQYGRWFERWYDNTDVPRLCREAASRGEKKLVLYDRNEFLKKYHRDSDNHAQYLVSRMEDDLMVLMLSQRLHSLSVYRKTWVEKTSFFGLGGTTTNYNQIIIDWSKE
jgi:hypothetical protein